MTDTDEVARLGAILALIIKRNGDDIRLAKNFIDEGLPEGYGIFTSYDEQSEEFVVGLRLPDAEQ